MPDTKKYRQTPNRGQEDVNKHGWKLNQIVHLARKVIGNRYNYCNYPEFNLPAGARARIIGIKQTSHNAEVPNGIGDVYIDFEMVDHYNYDGSPVTCGNRHSFTMCEAVDNFALCPDGSEEPGYIREHRNAPGEEYWFSVEAERVSDHPVKGYVRYQHRKVVDPDDASEMNAAYFV